MGMSGGKCSKIYLQLYYTKCSKSKTCVNQTKTCLAKNPCCQQSVITSIRLLFPTWRGRAARSVPENFLRWNRGELLPAFSNISEAAGHKKPVGGSFHIMLFYCSDNVSPLLPSHCWPKKLNENRNNIDGAPLQQPLDPIFPHIDRSFQNKIYRRGVSRTVAKKETCGFFIRSHGNSSVA